MADSLRFHPLVADDLSAATTWYDDISVDLGNRFRQSINARFDSVGFRPESFGLVHDKLRAARVDGFPYLVIFEHNNNVATIIGVFHAASDPDKWRGRKR
jgi:hypothetical protein